MNKQDIVNRITPILKQYPVSTASFFGSYAREDFTEDSDVDILVELDSTTASGGFGLMFSSLRMDLAEVLPIDLDLIYKPGLKYMEPPFVENITREERVFYEKDA